MNRRTRRLAGGAAALGAGAILIGPISALAQSDDDPPASTTPATTDDSTPTTPDAPDAPDVASRLAEVLQPLVDDGTLTQAQMDAVTQALQDARPVWGGHGPGGRHGGPGRFGAKVSLETAATTIGISEDDLRTALQDGQTLAEVATANGVEPQAVIDALVAEATTRLDQAVTDGRIEQADADARKAELTERITTAVNEGFPARGDGVGPGRHGDDESGATDSGNRQTRRPRRPRADPTGRAVRDRRPTRTDLSPHRRDTARSTRRPRPACVRTRS